MVMDDIKNVLNKNILKNVKIEENKEDLYHLTLIRQKKLIPNVSKRAGSLEDNTIPRIHTSNSLVGCIWGYAAMQWDMINLAPNKDRVGFGYNKNGILYKGGYYLYKIPYKYSVTPNKSLVPDVMRTNEKWLVTYNKDTLEYIPELVGKIIPTQITHTTNKDHYPTELVEIVIELTQEMRINKENTVGPGYYRIKLSEDGETIKKITKSEYGEHKSLKASMLSYCDWSG